MYPKSVPEEVAQAVDSNQIINLEDWSINFNEFQPDGIKQLKKDASEESQGNQDKRNDSSYNLGCDQYVSPYPNPEDTHTKFWNTEPPMFATTAERIAHRHRNPREPVCSAGRSTRRASPAFPPAHLDRQVHGGRRTLVCDSMTTAWPTSWAAPPLTS
jgi:hypothetical protein